MRLVDIEHKLRILDHVHPELYITAEPFITGDLLVLLGRNR